MEAFNRFAVHQLPGFHSVDNCRLFATSGERDEWYLKNW